MPGPNAAPEMTDIDLAGLADHLTRHLILNESHTDTVRQWARDQVRQLTTELASREWARSAGIDPASAETSA